jgi:hypothetical protein
MTALLAELKLLAVVCFLSLLLIQRRLSRAPQSPPSPPFRLTPQCRLGFDRSQALWTANAFDEQRFLFHQWRAVDALLRRRRRQSARRAFVLLLDGDDDARHYTAAAEAHATHLRRSNTSADVVLLLNGAGEHLEGAARRLSALVTRVIELDSLAYDTARVELIKHVNKVQLWKLLDYGKVVFIDLDVVLRGPQEHLFAYPGEPVSFLRNPENGDHFNSGISVIEPDAFVYERVLDTLRFDYAGGWDYTDQALSDAALRSVFGLLPVMTCPKKRMVYTHAAQWRHASPSCVHWTGEKPWLFQKRADLQALVPQWYEYMRANVRNYKPPKSDYKVP